MFCKLKLFVKILLINSPFKFSIVTFSFITASIFVAFIANWTSAILIGSFVPIPGDVEPIIQLRGPGFYPPPTIIPDFYPY